MSKIGKAVRRKNPSKLEKTAYSLGAGFAGFGLTKFASRLAYAQTVRRWPKLANHAKVGTSIVTAVGAHFGSQYWSKSAEFTEEITIGAGVAAVQAIVQTYLPKFAWLVSDPLSSEYSPPPAAQTKPSPDLAMLDEFEEIGPDLSPPSVEGFGDDDDIDLDNVIPMSMLGD